MADVDTGMDKADMKKLLTVSKKQPVNCAVGVTKTGVVLMMDKIKQPKAVLKDLEKKFADMKQPHWGSAVVDMDADPKLVVLTLNKAAPGMARKMKKTLKGTGFSKVEIRLEDGTVADTADEGDEEEEAGPAAAARPVEAAPAPADAAGVGPDAGVLTQQLTGLVGQLKAALAADPSRAEPLKALATQAQASLKSGDLPAAQSAVTQLAQALGGEGGAAPSAAPAPNMQALNKAKLAWSAARAKVEGDLGKLHGEMTKHFKGHGLDAELDGIFASKVQPIMSRLDEGLSKKLDEVAGNADPAQHTKLLGEAKQIVQQTSAFVAGEPMLAKLDTNPFVPVAIQKTLSSTLTALDRVVA